MLTRVASSHVRVGTFQFFAARGDVDAIRRLADHVIARHYPEAVDAANPYRTLLDLVISRQAELVAKWLLVGFIHGDAGSAGIVAGFENSSGECTINPTGSSVNCSSDATLKKNVEPLDASTTLAGVLALDPMLFNWNQEADGTAKHSGFIAQAVQPIFPDLVSAGSNGKLLLNYAGFTVYIVKAVQQLAHKLDDLANTVASFADHFTTRELTFTRATGDDLTVKHLHAGEACFPKSDGSEVCITGDQLSALLSQSAAAGLANPSPALPHNQFANPTPAGTTSTSTPPSTPPVIQISGENPAHINVGDNYADLGATITGPQADLNLGVKTFLNGALVSNIVLDTSTTTTDTIDYVATDTWGNTATATRSVIIDVAAAAAASEAQ